MRPTLSVTSVLSLVSLLGAPAVAAQGPTDAVDAPVTPAQVSQGVIDVPACEAEHVDLGLLRELLTMEIGEGAGRGQGALEVVIDPAICDASATQLTIVIHDLESGACIEERVPVSSDADDPASRARTLALAFAERVRVATHAPASAPTVLAEAIDETPEEFSRAGSAAAPGAPGYPPDSEPMRAPSAVWAGASLVGSLAPVAPMVTLGGRADVALRIDDAWRARVDLGAHWTRGSVADGDVDAVLAAIGGAVDATVARADAVELRLGARAEAGAVATFGTRPTGELTHPRADPWIAMGGTLELSWSALAALAPFVELEADAILVGIRVVEATGVPVELAWLALRLSVGVRIGT